MSLDLSSLDVVDREAIAYPTGGWDRLTIRVGYRDVRGCRRAARAHVYLPPSLLAGASDTAPLLHVAGYEIAGGVGMLLLPWWAERQPVIINPITPVGDEAWPGDNAIARGYNLDAALLHLARALPFVDDTRVLITGHSAGGLTTLMLATESFPVAGVAPDVALIDAGFNARYLLDRHALSAREDNELTGRPEVAMVVAQAMEILGDDTSNGAWWEHSPTGQLDAITCPVSLVMSSADLLVPIGQVDLELAQPYDATGFPESFPTDPKSLMGPDRPTLLELLEPDRVAIHHVPVPTTTAEIHVGEPVALPDWLTLDIPDEPDRDWNVVVLDEGPIEPWIDHMRYATLFARNRFFDRCLADPVPVGQLTAAKLHRLIDRYAGIEWSSTGVCHLDEPFREQADVRLGLRAYAGAGPAHRERFARLYGALPDERQALGRPDEAVAALLGPP